MRLSHAKLIGKVMEALRELGREAQEEIQFRGGAPNIRDALLTACDSIRGVVYQAAYQMELPAKLAPHEIIGDNIPEDARETNDEREEGNLEDSRDRLRQRMIQFRKIMIENGLPTNCEVDERSWLDGALKQGRHLAGAEDS